MKNGMKALVIPKEPSFSECYWKTQASGHDWGWHFKFLWLCEFHVGIAISVYAIKCSTEILLHSLFLVKDCIYNLKIITSISESEVTSKHFSALPWKTIDRAKYNYRSIHEIKCDQQPNLSDAIN